MMRSFSTITPIFHPRLIWRRARAVWGSGNTMTEKSRCRWPDLTGAVHGRHSYGIVGTA